MPCNEFDFLLRFAVAPQKLKFLRCPFTILDLIPIVVTAVSVLELFVAMNSHALVRSLKLVRALRLVWLFKLFRYSEGLQEVARTLWRARADIFLMVQLWFVVGFFFSGLVFLAESEEPDTMFSSMFDTMWFATVTMTTVGYGDMFPVTSK